MKLSYYDCSSSCGDLKGWHYINFMKKVFEKKNQNKLPERLVTGKDLINLGLEPGPQFKDILDEIYDYQLEYNEDDKGKLIDHGMFRFGLGKYDC